MSMPSGVAISDEAISASRSLRFGRGPNKPRFVIYKISDDETTVELCETSTEPDYETFLQSLCGAVDSNGKPMPRFAAYDVEYDLGEDGKRSRLVFISWVPQETALKLCMLYATTKEKLRNAVDIKLSIHADTPDELEWRNIVSLASGGKM
ncbi:actin-binding ADF family protein [Aspergillus saccharolyticus JOP 1030-1]|uniref:Cofilin n=1 Tax=Aspergillus saccharolyticus JOP 1030-1 TaxID=1450539 RepID=A0A318ZUR6_9EURO|nr:cofilin, actophorin [Aspergillus saccharolyticus JOP 1030-1]PYH48093.1 cofilin, actophorin [Aspergillus saccharolyticus JOP 1030-1]